MRYTFSSEAGWPAIFFVIYIQRFFHLYPSPVSLDIAHTHTGTSMSARKKFALQWAAHDNTETSGERGRFIPIRELLRYNKASLGPDPRASRRPLTAIAKVKQQRKTVCAVYLGDKKIDQARLTAAVGLVEMHRQREAVGLKRKRKAGQAWVEVNAAKAGKKKQKRQPVAVGAAEKKKQEQGEPEGG